MPLLVSVLSNRHVIWSDRVFLGLLLIENDMDGEAVSLAFASCSGPDCIKDVIPKYGLRLKVYQAIKREIEAHVQVEPWYV
jgi:hypothetical protein